MRTTSRIRRLTALLTAAVATTGVALSPIAAAAASCCRICDGADPQRAAGEDANGTLRSVYDFYSTSQTGHTRAVNDAGLTARARVLTPMGGWTCGTCY